MENVRLYPYNAGSESAAALASALGIRRISIKNSKFVGSPKHTILNWGATAIPPQVLSAGRIINPPDRVRHASNKLRFFETVNGAEESARPRIPEWTTSFDTAVQWIGEKKHRRVFARMTLAGHSGEGIVDCATVAELEQARNAPLFVAYVPKRDEFRIHIAQGNPFLVQRKAFRRDPSVETEEDESIWRIRNHSNGFIFARNDARLPSDDVLTQAVRALNVTGLDFGAVDVIWNRRLSEAFVLEVNTAPGIEGSTLEDYRNAISKLLS